MKEERLHELLQLYVLDELNNSDRAELENHLENSEQARIELENIQILFSIFSEIKPVEINEDLLITSRQNLLRQIRIDGSRENFYTKIISWLEHINVNGYKLAESSVSAIVVGILLGYMIFSGNPVNTSAGNKVEIINIDNIISSDRSLSNIRFDTDPASGSIQISFDAVKSLTYNGDMNDEVVKYLLASALLNNKNPGSRLRTVNAIVEQTVSSNNFIRYVAAVKQASIKRALINTCEDLKDEIEEWKKKDPELDNAYS